MNPRERLELTIAGKAADRSPVALWRHFPGDDQRSADHANAILAHQQTYNWDFTVIYPASTYNVTDYGVQSEWRGKTNGDRTITKHVVNRSLDWTELRTLDPQRGELGKQWACAQQIGETLEPNIPLLMTVYSPLSQAARIAGDNLLHRNLRTHSDRLRSGLNTITDNTLRWIQALSRTPIQGILYIIEQAQYDRLSETEYSEFGIPYDRKILNELPRHWWFNMLHLEGESAMFRLVQDYPVQAVNWRGKRPDWAQGKSLLRGAAAGGLSTEQDLHFGTPSHVRSVAREAVQLTNGRRFILTADGAYSPSTPLSNIRAVRASVESGGS